MLATIILYYQFYIPAAVATSIIAHFGMTFDTYVYILVIANAVGAFGSLAAGLADRWGRANLVAYGLVTCRNTSRMSRPRPGRRPGSGRTGGGSASAARSCSFR